MSVGGETQDPSPLCHTSAPLLSLSLTSHVLQFSPFHFPLAIPQRKSPLTRTGVIFPLNINGGGGERRGATPTHCLAGEDPWPFAPVAFFWATESVSWPLLLNVERPLTGCRGSRGSIWRESEWEVAEWSAAVWLSTGFCPLDQIWPLNRHSCTRVIFRNWFTLLKQFQCTELLTPAPS